MPFNEDGSRKGPLYKTSGFKMKGWSAFTKETRLEGERNPDSRKKKDESWPDHLSESDIEMLKNQRKLKKKILLPEDKDDVIEKDDVNESDYMRKRELTYDPSKHRL